MIYGKPVLLPRNYNSKPLVTNILPLAQEADGTPFNGGLGYKAGYRLNTSGGETEYASYAVTGFIPVSLNDEIRCINIGLGESVSPQALYMGVYDTSHTFLKNVVGSFPSSEAVPGFMYGVKVLQSTVGYIRLAFNASMVDKLIITKNQKVSALEDGTSSDCVNCTPTKVNLIWHQDVEAVRNYIANVTYPSNDYTTTQITNYVPTPAVASDTKPTGYTFDGVTYYNEIPNGNTPFSSANYAGTVNPLDQVRWINSQTSNFRDIGGWPCDGGTVKYGLIYRSGELAAADEDLLINKIGIRTEVDLTADGAPAYPNKMRFIGHTSYAMYSLTNTDAWLINLRGIIESLCYSDPVVFHCSMGADRTGTLACMLEGLLGMSQSDIDKDYELTSFYAMRARNDNYQGGTADWAHLIEQIETLTGSTFRDKCVTFALSVGITIDEINTYRSIMIDGTPETLHAPTVNITNALTNCTTNNSNSTIEISKPYSATITANSGYTLEGATVSITMGGTDITTTAYSNRVISIPFVSGAIVITISAASEVHMKELFNPNAALLNVRFSSTGSTSAQDGSFCSDYIEIGEGSLTSSAPYRIYIRDTTNPTMFNYTATNEAIVYCKADKSIISANYGRLIINMSSGTNTLRKYVDADGGVYIDINQTGDGNYIPSAYFDMSQVKYIRVSMRMGSSAITSTDIANVSIKSPEITESQSPSYTNLADYGGSDWKFDYRIRSIGELSTQSGSQVSNVILVAAGDIIRIKHGTANSEGYINYTQNCLSAIFADASATSGTTFIRSNYSYDSTNDIVTFTIPSGANGYARFMFKTSDVQNDIIITRNESIE